MKRIIVVFLMVSVPLLFAVTAGADPRMETNNNFCHFILDPFNGDNEVFYADCGAVITVTENEEPDPLLKANPGEESECIENYSASGYATGEKIVPALAAPLPPGTNLVLTSRDSDYKCYMKESNNRTYRSGKWISKISVSERDDAGFVKVSYRLLCI